ncbi:sialate O-acetylesterase [Chitinophaga niabensis]|uniref:sialate O-acetylesterase n=1 Tax=Chitinophaga niabensis TaxID=536979 RepID=UPI0031B9FE05
MQKKLSYFIAVLLFLATATQAQTKKQNFHLYLLAGQSNMAGRGIVEPQDTIGNPRILSLNKEGNWVIAKDPVHFDKSAAGVGPGLTFAREMLKQDPNIVIGLIPCAAGGSGIDNWLYNQYWEQTKSYPWDNAVMRTELAMKEGTLKGILWHQGESDSAPEKAKLYAGKLESLVIRFRKEFNLPKLPFIAGELPEFNKRAAAINTQLYEAGKKLRFYGVVSGKGLTPNADNLHIDAASQRIFGKRYAEKMKQL